jgi:hypothetical protein
LGFLDQFAEDFIKGFLAHEFLHLCDGDEILAEDVRVSCGIGGFNNGIFVAAKMPLFLWFIYLNALLFCK